MYPNPGIAILEGGEIRGLKTFWQDPDFVADQEAFYYVRVLENPTCRWSTWDAVQAGVAPRPDLQKTIQERAWSSPIWYRVLQQISREVNDKDTLPGTR